MNAAPQPGPKSISARWYLFTACAVTFLAYAQTLQYDFVYDDWYLIYNNGLIRTWASLPHFFTHHLWSHLRSDAPGAYYRPLYLVWFTFIHTLFALKPWGWHLSTVLAHAVATGMVFATARRITGSAWTAYVAALVFGLHPVHVESVAWIGASDTLLTIFLLASLLAWLRPEPKRQLLAFLWFAVAMLIKEGAVVFPVFLLLMEAFARPDGASAPAPLRPRLQNALLRSLPFFLIAGLYMTARQYVLQGLAIAGGETSLGTALLTRPSIDLFWVRHLLWPIPQAEFYELAPVTGPGWSSFFLPLLITLAAAATLLVWASRNRTARFAILWMALFLAPTLSLSFFHVGDQLHDRYLYLPSVGFAILVALALERLRPLQPQWKGQPVAALAVLAVLCGLMAWGTTSQSRYWKDNLTLFQRAVEVSPNDKYSLVYLAGEYGVQGRDQDAIPLYLKTLGLDPNVWMANYNLALTYDRQNQWEKAEPYYRQAIALRPGQTDQYVYLALSLMKRGRYDDAAGLIRQALERRPDAIGYHYALGLVLERKGKMAEAQQEFQVELQRDPDGPARQKLGR